MDVYSSSSFDKEFDTKMTMIPLQQQTEEENSIGQFYSLNQHILPKEVHVPKHLDKTMIQSVVDTKIVQPARGAKKKW